MIAVISYKAGNLASVQHALDRGQIPYYLAKHPEELEPADGIIFPGVGHASSAMDSLREQQLISYLQQTTKPLLGICVGMQLLFDASAEATPNGTPTQALGCLSGSLERFEPKGNKEDKVPHMGWNQINYTQAHPLCNDIPSGSTFYFVHSYFAPITPWTLATCEYIREFSAVVERDNYLGVQFHPEKSGATGAQLLHNFHEIVRSHSCK